MLVSEKGFGEVVDTAAITAMLQIASFVVGVFYGKIAKTFRNYVLLPGWRCRRSGFWRSPWPLAWRWSLREARFSA